MDSAEEGECSTSNVDDGVNAGRIRKRRFSNARIQPTRIKKVMQSDEDIGRMVASVPVAIGSAMEHFAEKFLEAAAHCVQTTSSRTLSPMHMRLAVMKNPHFAFLESIMKDIPLPKLTPAAEGSGHLMTSPPFDNNQQQQFLQMPSYNIGAYDHSNVFAEFKQFPPPLPPIFSQQPTDPASVSHVPKPAPNMDAKYQQGNENDACVKRKRGRPKKERKERFVQDGLVDGFQQTTNEARPVHPMPISKNGQSLPSSSNIQPDADTILMPPPKLPLLVRPFKPTATPNLASISVENKSPQVIPVLKTSSADE